MSKKFSSSDKGTINRTRYNLDEYIPSPPRLTPYNSMSCSIIYDMLIEAKKENLDLDNLVKLLMTTEYGIGVMVNYYWNEYTCGASMLEGFKKQFDIGIANHNNYDNDILMTCAYVYKIWVDENTDEPNDIYCMANLSMLNDNYPQYTSQGFYWVIEDIKQNNFIDE